MSRVVRTTRQAGRSRPQPFTLAITANALGVSRAAAGAPTRQSARSARARQIAMYLAHVGLGQDYSTIGRAFGRDPSTARHACARIEERRDEAGLDCILRHLEWASGVFLVALAPAVCGGR